MTRINVGVKPVELNDKMLIAEHREIKRIPNQIKSGRFIMKGQPDNFTLNKGHVKFFYDKLGYLLNRYKKIYEECKSRGFNVQDYSSAWQGIEPKYMNDYKPTPQDRSIILERIKERLTV